eukprot:CCRYP_014067-RA/>CCRYP_014067-RA protein AED:0.37 eAED:0.37 QI:161/0/0.5/1/0/0/2/0/61
MHSIAIIRLISAHWKQSSRENPPQLPKGGKERPVLWEAGKKRYSRNLNTCKDKKTPDTSSV